MYVYLVIVYDMMGILSHAVFRTQEEAFTCQRKMEEMWKNELTRNQVRVDQVKQCIPF